LRFQHGELHLVILALVAEHPMHGYELMSELSRRLGRRYRASPGSIYPAIQSLESEGLLAGREDGDRRIYELTNEGRAALDNRRDRLVLVEKRFGVRFGSGFEIVLGRFSDRVREAWVRLDDDTVERVLDRAASEIETMAKRERKP
jgi:DNA-binding PadR family transcriptional regulator